MDNRMIAGINVKDDLTGLYVLSWLMTRTGPDGPIRLVPGMSFYFFNVMNFRTFNRRFGYEAGNEYLCALADNLTAVFDTGIVARAGGDHFAVIATDLDKEAAIRKLEEFNAAMAEHDRGLKIHIKTGVYIADENDDDITVMLDRAKVACDLINGVYDRDIEVFDGEMKYKNDMKHYVIEHFEEAFEKDYITVYYQPVTRALTGRVCGFEALARWVDPVKGVISPGIFVDVMESVRVVHRLDSFIIDRVCQDIRGIIDSGLPCQPVSVNLSQLDFELCDITDVVFSTMKKYDIPKNLIAIEITESAVASGMKMLDEKIREFRAHGLEVWIDDFGSGYSSFSNLQNHDFDTLKIDMGFVRGIGNNPKSEVIIASIVSMSKRLGLASLAEGVETEEQYEFLRRIGCGLIQGYFFGKPEPYENRVTKTSKVAVQPEEPSMRAYYDKICSVNLLSNNPHAIISDFDDQPFNSYNSLPILLIEVDWTDYTVSFLYINNAYRKFMESIGIRSTDEIESFFGAEARENMRKVYEDAENNPDEVLSFNVDLDDKTVIKCRIRFLARAGETCAYSFSARLKDS